MVDQAKQGEATPQQLFDYYLGYLTDPSVTNHYQPVPDSTVPFARGWGMKVEVEDLRQVVKQAEKLGGKVVVGGHSLGGSITTAYATWDFNGKPGAERPLRARLHRRRVSGPTPITPSDASTSASTTSTPARPGSPSAASRRRSPACSTSSARPASHLDPNGLGALQTWPPLPANLKPPVAADQRGRLRLRARHRDLAADPGRRPGAPRPPGRQRRPARLGPRRRAHPDPALRGHVLRHRAARPRRHRLVPPAAADDRRRRGRRRESPTRPRTCSTSQATHGADLPRKLRISPSAPRSAASGCSTRPRRSRRSRASRASSLSLINRATTYAHNDPNSAYPKNDFVSQADPVPAQDRARLM